jgi:predicted small lipoprotein YifL
MKEIFSKSAIKALPGVCGLILLFALQACGQKGPLQRPAQSSAETPAIPTHMVTQSS